MSFLFFSPFEEVEEWETLFCHLGDESSKGCQASGQLLDVFLGPGGFHFYDGLYFFWVCFNTSVADHEAQEFPSLNPEGAFLWIQSHVAFSEVFKALLEVFDVVRYGF